MRTWYFGFLWAVFFLKCEAKGFFHIYQKKKNPRFLFRFSECSPTLYLALREVRGEKGWVVGLSSTSSLSLIILGEGEK